MEQQIAAMWVQIAVSAIVGEVQCQLIARGLGMMTKASEDRNRQLDIMEARQHEQSQVLVELLRRTA